MVRRVQRQLPFLQSVLREANQNVRRERLPHANADQVNAISELVMKTFKGNVEVPPHLLDQLVVGGQAARLTDSDLRLAFEQQTHFRSSLLSLRKIASAISSCKTISMTSFFFSFTRPMKLSDRKMLLNTRGKLRGLTTASEAALCTRDRGNAKKSYLG